MFRLKQLTAAHFVNALLELINCPLAVTVENSSMELIYIK